jgi:tetratricopeptide (TPR) repeat protein
MSNRLQKAEEEVSRHRQAGNSPALAVALKRLGQLERQSGLNDAAVAHYQEAVEICRTQNNLSALAHTIRHLGDIHLEAQRFDSAESCYRESLSLYRGEREVPPLDFANALRSMALLQGNLGAKEDAKSLWQEARNLYLKLEVKEGVAECDRWLFRLK